MAVTPLPPGTELLPYTGGSHRYAILGVIKAGGFGITYRAEDRDLGIEVAIKELAFSESMCRDTTSQMERPSEEVLKTVSGQHAACTDEGQCVKLPVHTRTNGGPRDEIHSPSIGVPAGRPCDHDACTAARRPYR